MTLGIMTIYLCPSTGPGHRIDILLVCKLHQGLLFTAVFMPYSSSAVPGIEELHSKYLLTGCLADWLSWAWLELNYSCHLLAIYHV